MLDADLLDANETTWAFVGVDGVDEAAERLLSALAMLGRDGRCRSFCGRTADVCRFLTMAWKTSETAAISRQNDGGKFGSSLWCGGDEFHGVAPDRVYRVNRAAMGQQPHGDDIRVVTGTSTGIGYHPTVEIRGPHCASPDLPLGCRIAAWQNTSIMFIALSWVSSQCPPCSASTMGLGYGCM